MAKFGKTIGKVQAYAAYGGMKAAQGINRVKSSVNRAKNSVKYAYNNVKNRVHIRNKTNAQNKFSKDSYKARESGKKSVNRLKAYNAGSMAKMDDIKSKQAELWKNLGVSSSSGPAPAVARAIPTATTRPMSVPRTTGTKRKHSSAPEMGGAPLGPNKRVRAKRPTKPSSKVLPLGAKPSSKVLPA
jgi:hypothetical protein